MLLVVLGKQKNVSMTRSPVLLKRRTRSTLLSSDITTRNSSTSSSDNKNAETTLSCFATIMAEGDVKEEQGCRSHQRSFSHLRQEQKQEEAEQLDTSKVHYFPDDCKIGGYNSTIIGWRTSSNSATSKNERAQEQEQAATKNYSFAGSSDVKGTASTTSGRGGILNPYHHHVDNNTDVLAKNATGGAAAIKGGNLLNEQHEEKSFPLKFDYLSSFDPALGEKIQGSAKSLYEMMKNMDRSLQHLDDVPDDTSSTASSRNSDDIIGGDAAAGNIASDDANKFIDGSYTHTICDGNKNHQSGVVPAPPLLSSSFVELNHQRRRPPWGQEQRHDNFDDEIRSGTSIDTISSPSTKNICNTMWMMDLRERDNFLKHLKQRLLQFVYFIQGPLTGLSIATFYDICLSSLRRQERAAGGNGNDAISLVVVSALMNDLGIQRLCIILNVICMSGMIIQVPLQHLVSVSCHDILRSIRSSTSRSGASSTSTTNNITGDETRNTQKGASSYDNEYFPDVPALHRIVALFLYSLSAMLTMLIARSVMIFQQDDHLEKDDILFSNINTTTTDLEKSNITSSNNNNKAMIEKNLVVLTICRVICCLIAWAMESFSSFSSLSSPLISSSSHTTTRTPSRKKYGT
jgi:hypothetical protein